MARRRGTLVALAALGAAVVATGPGTGSASTAVFTSSSTSTATIRAAADWTPPAVALQRPAPVVSGQVTLVADASDGETAIVSVTVQSRRAGGAWRRVCTDTTAPYSCAWDTTGLPAGAYELRATARDGSGLVATSAAVTAQVEGQVEGSADPAAGEP